MKCMIYVYEYKYKYILIYFTKGKINLKTQTHRRTHAQLQK